MPQEREQPHEQSSFSDIARSCSKAFGSPWAFVLACGAVLAWALFGPATGYSATWQLLINTGTTIVTFLMVFLIQNTQNRDSRALHLKLDELIRTQRAARNKLIDLENCSDEEVEEIARQFEGLRKRNSEAHATSTDRI